MNFCGQSVESVFREYERRAGAERLAMATMAPGEGMSRRDEFLLPVGRDAAWFLHSLVVARKPSIVLELGTSYGYSTLFLADAVAQCDGRLVTMENADYKQVYARDMIAKAGLSDRVEFRLGDAVTMIGEQAGPFDLVLLDIWKELYVPCFEAFYPKLSDEAIIAADNMIEPEIARPDVREYRAALQAKHDLQTTLLPIGSGIELTCKWPSNSDKL